MGIGKVLQYVDVETLWLDPQNPRIGRAKRQQCLDQERLLQTMSVWTLEELVDSFLIAGGFWTQDALIVVNERHDEQDRLVVVEGNRRLAALKLMRRWIREEPTVPWVDEHMRGSNLTEDDELFTQAPFLVADSRKDVDAYLGFRHVTGIKEWPPAEKSEFITRLLETEGLTYKDVARQVGSRSDSVRHHYVAFKILQQIEQMLPREEWEEIESKFSVLLLAMRSSKVRDFLGIDTISQPKGHHDPIPQAKKEDLRRFIEWLFGARGKRPIVGDSRNVDKFAEILAEPRAVEYLRKSEEPRFEVAYSLTRAAADLVIDPLREAKRQIALALAEIGGRGQEVEVQYEAWPVIEGSVRLAEETGDQNLTRARELIGAS